MPKRWIMLAVILVALAVDASALRAQADAQTEAVCLAIAKEDTSALRDALAALARTTSIDAAADAFVQAMEAVPRNREFRARFEAALARGTTLFPSDQESAGSPCSCPAGSTSPTKRPARICRGCNRY
jgi:hypothetical protein